MFKKHPEAMRRMLSVIEKDSPIFDKTQEYNEEEVEDYCLSLLLKAMCYKTLGETEKAENHLHELLQFENDLGDDIYLATWRWLKWDTWL
ncbi:tetratricopeptide repeat protein 39B, partial [Caerostris extrusa]